MLGARLPACPRYAYGAVGRSPAGILAPAGLNIEGVDHGVAKRGHPGRDDVEALRRDGRRYLVQQPGASGARTSTTVALVAASLSTSHHNAWARQSQGSPGAAGRRPAGQGFADVEPLLDRSFDVAPRRGPNAGRRVPEGPGRRPPAPCPSSLCTRASSTPMPCNARAPVTSLNSPGRSGATTTSSRSLGRTWSPPAAIKPALFFRRERRPRRHRPARQDGAGPFGQVVDEPRFPRRPGGWPGGLAVGRGQHPQQLQGASRRPRPRPRPRRGRVFEVAPGGDVRAAAGGSRTSFCSDLAGRRWTSPAARRPRPR